MQASRVVPTVVIGLAVLLAAGVLVLYVVNPVADYANLVPAPNEIIWEQGDDTTVWLQTNRQDVDLKIDSVALGLGSIQRVFPEAGASMALGRQEGCLEWAVSSLEVHSYDGTSLEVRGTINRNGFTGTAGVELRSHFAGSPSWLGASVAVPTGSNTFSYSVTASTTQGTEAVYVVEASHNDDFSEVYTRTVSTDLGDADNAVYDAKNDTDAETLYLVQDMGVGLIACSEHDDVVITLHGEDGEELNRYLVDIHQRPTPGPARPPPDAGYSIRQVCVDSADSQTNYLSGSEEVGDTFDAADFGLAGTIQSVQLADIGGNDFRWFFAHSLTSGEVQLRVTAAGASELGLDSNRVYPIRLTATDDTIIVPDDLSTPEDEEVVGATAHLDVGVWVDMSTLSPTDNGRCS